MGLQPFWYACSAVANKILSLSLSLALSRSCTADLKTLRIKECDPVSKLTSTQFCILDGQAEMAYKYRAYVIRAILTRDKKNYC